MKTALSIPEMKQIKTPLEGKTEDDLVICIWDGTKDDPDAAVTLVTKNAEGQYEKRSLCGRRSKRISYTEPDKQYNKIS